MNKEELLQLLKSYKENTSKKALREKRIKKLKKELENIEEKYDTQLTPVMHDGGRGNQVVSQTENVAIKRQDRIKEIEKEISDIEAEIELLNDQIEEVDIRLGSLKRIEYEILVARYIDGQSYEYIGNITYYNVCHQTRSAETMKKELCKILNKITLL